MAQATGSQLSFLAVRSINLVLTATGTNLPAPISTAFNIEVFTAQPQSGFALAPGYDASVFLPKQRLEIGTSYQRFLESRHINSVAAYLSWQPRSVPVDLKAEFDASYNGRGYWLETAYKFSQLPIPRFLQRTQVVGRMQQVFPSHGGGNGIPRVDSQRFDFGLNYYIRDDLRIISSYGRRFSSQQNANVWNVGLTYRFLFPLWPGKK